jgi:hypothetical protein
MAAGHPQDQIGGKSMSRARLARTVAAAIPLLLVNIVAFSGQYAYLQDHLHWALAGQITVALALESVAIFLALHAHVAALANDSALRLRLAAYAFAAVIGAMNYSHFALPNWRPTFAAIAVGLMSASSPWLWAVHSRRASRDALMARGLIEPHALRLGATRWLWHPVRSARVMWYATWTGIQSPAEAIAAAEPQHADSRAGLAGVRTLAGAIRYAMAEIARGRGVDIAALSAREIAGWLQDHASSLPMPWTFSTSYIADVQRRTIAARERAAKNKVMQLRRHTA